MLPRKSILLNVDKTLNCIENMAYEENCVKRKNAGKLCHD